MRCRAPRDSHRIERAFSFIAMKLRDKLSVRDLIYNKYEGHCAYCGCEITKDNFHVDHIDARFRGSTDKELATYDRARGLNNIENYNPSCISCNSSKSTLTIENWRKEIELKVRRINRDVSGFRLLKRFGLVVETGIPVKFHFEKHQL